MTTLNYFINIYMQGVIYKGNLIIRTIVLTILVIYRILKYICYWDP